MSFNIGNQTGGVINNVAGDQHIAGDQRGNALSLASVRDAARELRDVLENLDCDPRAKVSALAESGGIETELQKPDPDRSRVGTALDKVAAVLLSAGAAATAGQSLIGPVQAISAWVGTWGPSVAQLLAR